MKKFNIISLLFAIFGSLTFLACQEETPTLGSGIAAGEVVITVDTSYFNLGAKPVLLDNFDSKTGNLMIGNLDVPDYGILNCSFVTRLMCAPKLEVDDSLFYPERVDSCKLIFGIGRDEIVGDSLAPQKLAVYLLKKQLPSVIDNTFDPEGYYDNSDPLGSATYTVSNISSSDSAFYKQDYVELQIDLGKEFGQEIFEKYKNQPEIFQWPQSMAEYFIPGLYVKPTFGKGCVANIFQTYLGVFYHSKELKTTVTEGDTVTTLTNVRRVAIPFTVSPEVLSSNNISYTPSQKIIDLNNIDNGECVLTTPGGYITTFDFPAQQVIEKYNEKNTHLATVNDLILHIPADTLATSSNIPLVSNLLLVKTSEYEDFFNKNKIPDNKTSFTGVYNPNTGYYTFSSMREYILALIQKGEVTKEDVEFTLVPVEITTETVSSGYYYGTTSTYVTKCVPYTSKPTLTVLNTGKAMVVFSFSSQMID